MVDSNDKAADLYICPVCGYPELTEPPRYRGSASFEMCPCCYFQFGYSDDARGFTYEQWRKQWVERGMPWCSKRVGEVAPEGWDPVRQLENIERGDTG